MASTELTPQCSRTALDNIGSDHLPIIIELRKRQKVFYSNAKFWNFKKANWDSFRDSVDRELTSMPLNDDLNSNWQTFKKTIFKHAKAFIPRGNVKRFVPHYAQSTTILDPLFEKRKHLIETVSLSENNLRPEINIFCHPILSSSEITFLELFSRKKAQNKAEWLVLPSHH
ncbi:hypothetical protein AVEN_263277-1 [Araneus ventricosus]|uniref:Endonuclease/exonuclease/phosphatase domain-containing protein n=1 Tax=Araneus ventricosus TaxID=182803 RepID=A0A4Y2HHL7_ARAVE|nr:hypothetical protein AVEN_263277-1 [Araneus ventricosus]